MTGNQPTLRIQLTTEEISKLETVKEMIIEAAAVIVEDFYKSDEYKKALSEYLDRRLREDSQKTNSPTI